MWGEGEGHAWGSGVMEMVFLGLWLYGYLPFSYLLHCTFIFCALFLYLCYICINLKVSFFFKPHQVYINCRVVVTFGKGKKIKNGMEFQLYLWRFMLRRQEILSKKIKVVHLFNLDGG